MLSLPLCRWRDELADDQHRCRSPKFVQAPNVVSAQTCRQCGYADHDPPASAPRALPCVHLGNWTGKSARLRDGESRDLFGCELHGRCATDGAALTLPARVRGCGDCTDYLPRDPFGPNSAEMKRRADKFLTMVPQYPTDRFRGRGVVIAGGGDRYFASLYVTIRALRHVGCALPIQVWYLGRNKEMPADKQALLSPWQVECIDADKVRRKHPARRLDGWELKVFAALHCSFEELLFLDADCYPCRNPEFLFDNEDYLVRGAIFWPDSMISDDRLKWRAFSIPDPDRPGTVESGQFVIHKRTSWRALNLAWFYNDHSDYYYRYGYGDKHTLEAAWTRLEQRFVMFTSVARLSQVGYLHIGPDKQTLFVHRCSDKFRLDAQQYATSQRQELPIYCPEIPLERQCWDWLGELARIVGKPIYSPEGTVLRAVTTPAAQVTVATLYTSEIRAYGELTANVLRRYAALHGYRVLAHSASLDPKRPPSWSKILLIERAFKIDPSCVWLMWIDADALILRHETPLTDFLDDDADFIVGDDPNCLLNSGVFFVRNCAAVKSFLRRAYKKTHLLHHVWWENAAIIETIREGVRGLRVKIVPRKLFNSFASEYRDGDFAIHFAGQSTADRIRAIRGHADRLTLP